MAGGSGTRLWPASTSSRPKQFLNLPGSSGEARNLRHSFFTEALERALAVTGGLVIIVAGKNHVNPIVDECMALNAEDRKRLVLIPEPMAKNTAPAIACALFYLNAVSEGKDRNVLVLTSDHIIGPMGTFKTDADAAAEMARQGKLAVFGIKPEKPETGYGYIEAGKQLAFVPDEKKTRRQYKPEVFAVESFREKPDPVTAKKFIAAKKFFWNSGMFAFSSAFMLAEFRRNAPEVAAPFKKLLMPDKHSYRTKKGLRILESWGNLENAYRKTTAISFDYAIVEKCDTTVMVKAGFSWIDVGSWDEYARLAGQQTAGHGAEVYGNSKTKNACFVDSDIPVALLGVEDLIVVVRSGKDGGGGPRAVLISKKGETQRVKDIVAEIKAAGKTELL
jgi:mannose-1-phosphate guanylyltransferase/mannose-6-phosphate isomerase